MSGHSIKLDDPVILGCTIGAMIPDLDIVAHFKGRLNYLLKHRGVSHSIPVLTGMSLGLSGILYGIYPTTHWTTIFIWTLIGVFSHGISDILNSFGAQLLWPFYRKKITSDMIMLTDPVITLIFLSSIIVTVKNPQQSIEATILALGFSILYIVYKQLSKIKSKNLVAKYYNIDDKTRIKILPAMYRLISWNFIIDQETTVSFGIIRNNNPQICRVLPRWQEDNPTIIAALNGSLAKVFNKFTPYYHIITDPYDDNNEQNNFNVKFLDLRYWSKENFLYTGHVIMDHKGKIAQETFYFSPNTGILLSY